MEFNDYLNIFQKAADKLNKKLLLEKQINVAVGIVLDSVFLKLYKNSWTNSLENPLTDDTRIFFSIWVNDSTLTEQKISYNIHAFKLRKLKGYVIESRKFANAFRTKFKSFEHQWPNINVQYGPLTLMEGWVKFDQEKIESEILKLSNAFLEIEHFIDNTLSEFKKE